jgi:hypothetical protein
LIGCRRHLVERACDIVIVDLTEDG